MASRKTRSSIDGDDLRTGQTVGGSMAPGIGKAPIRRSPRPDQPPAVANTGNITQLGLGAQKDHFTSTEKVETITPQEERVIQRALRHHERSRSRSRSRTRSRAVSGDRTGSQAGAAQGPGSGRRRGASLSVLFNEQVAVREFYVSSDESSAGLSLPSSPAAKADPAKHAGAVPEPRVAASGNGGGGGGLQPRPPLPNAPAVAAAATGDAAQDDNLDRLRLFLSSIWASSSPIRLWVRIMVDTTYQTVVLLAQNGRPALVFGFRILRRVPSLFVGAEVVLSVMLAIAISIALCCVAMSLWLYLADWIHTPLQVLGFACWVVIGVGRMAWHFVTMSFNSSPSSPYGLPRKEPSSSATLAMSSSTTTGKMPPPISTLPSIHGPQLGIHQFDTINTGLGSNNDDGREWVGARVVYDVLVRVPGALESCANNDGDEMPIIGGLRAVRKSRQERTHQAHKLRSDIHEALSGAFEKVQMLQRQIRASPLSESVGIAGNEKGKKETPTMTPTTAKADMKSDKASSSSVFWMPGWVEVGLAEKAAAHWMRAMEASLDKMEQRASTMVNVTTSINSICTDKAVQKLQQAVQNGSKQQAAMVHAILWHAVELGVTDWDFHYNDGDGEDNDSKKKQQQQQQQQDESYPSTSAAGVNDNDADADAHDHGPDAFSRSNTTKIIKKETISPSIMKMLSESLDAMEVALSYETTQLEAWLYDVAAVATQASKLQVKAAQVEHDARALRSLTTQQLALLEERLAQRNWGWTFVISIAGRLSGPSVDFVDLDSSPRARAVDIGGGNHLQEWYESWMANMDRWDGLLLGVAGDSEALMLTLT